MSKILQLYKKFFTENNIPFTNDESLVSMISNHVSEIKKHIDEQYFKEYLSDVFEEYFPDIDDNITSKFEYHKTISEEDDFGNIDHYAILSFDGKKLCSVELKGFHEEPHVKCNYENWDVIFELSQKIPMRDIIRQLFVSNNNVFQHDVPFLGGEHKKISKKNVYKLKKSYYDDLSLSVIGYIGFGDDVIIEGGEHQLNENEKQKINEYISEMKKYNYNFGNISYTKK